MTMQSDSNRTGGHPARPDTGRKVVVEGPCDRMTQPARDQDRASPNWLIFGWAKLISE